VTDLFRDNLAALLERSPETGRRVEASPVLRGFGIASSADGGAIVEQGGHPLESRRAPVEAARRQAAAVPFPRVAVAGIGAGYLVEALFERGVEVAAIVEDGTDALVAAMSARDLRAILRQVPVVLLDTLGDATERVLFKSRVSDLAPLGGRVAGSAGLGALVTSWPRIPPPTRPPRVLVVGPIYGGSLETSRSTARAMTAIGADTSFLDFAPFGEGWRAIEQFELPTEGRRSLQASLAEMLGETVVRRAEAWKPDLVLALAQAPLSEPSLRRLREMGSRTAFWFVENGRVLPYWKDVARSYDVFFAIQVQPFIDQVKAAGAARAVYLPTACDRERHVPVVLTPEERSRYETDVSFAGAPYLNRRRLLGTLADWSPRIWGEGWDQTELASMAVGTGHRFSLDEMVRVFAGSRVNLNIHSAAHTEGLDPDPDYLNPRTFELAACAAFQLVDARQPLRDAFAETEVVSFRSVSELRECLSHYLAHPEERQAFARRARARALAAHTFEHRAREILREAVGPDFAAGAILRTRRGGDDTLDAAIDHAGQASPEMTRDEALLRLLGAVRSTK
jgi:spore maturation protein CgeB